MYVKNVKTEKKIHKMSINSRIIFLIKFFTNIYQRKKNEARFFEAESLAETKYHLKNPVQKIKLPQKGQKSEN